MSRKITDEQMETFEELIEFKKKVKEELISKIEHRFRNDLDYIVPFREIIEEVFYYK